MISTVFDITKYYMRFGFNKITNNGFEIKKIIVFDERGDYENVSTSMSIEDIKKNILLDSYKIEIRYVVNGKKYRAVIRDSDNVKFPIRKELGIPVNFKITHAYVYTQDSVQIDVTERVLKYAGQNLDFNRHANCALYAKDIFPFDNAGDFFKLSIVDDRTLEYKTFAMDDILVV